MNVAKYLKMENKKWPSVLQWIHPKDWPETPHLAADKKPVQVFRSSRFLVQAYDDNGFTRLSVLRTELGAGGRYRDGITWEELQRLKAQAGYGDKWAVEVFPPDDLVVNIQNMRHVFLLHEPPAYGWGAKR